MAEDSEISSFRPFIQLLGWEFGLLLLEILGGVGGILLAAISSSIPAVISGVSLSLALLSGLVLTMFRAFHKQRLRALESEAESRHLKSRIQDLESERNLANAVLQRGTPSVFEELRQTIVEAEQLLISDYRIYGGENAEGWYERLTEVEKRLTDLVGKVSPVEALKMSVISDPGMMASFSLKLLYVGDGRLTMRKNGDSIYRVFQMKIKAAREVYAPHAGKAP